MRKAKKILWILAASTMILGLAALGTLIKEQHDRGNEYYIFTETASEMLLSQLDKHEIPYVVDEAGRLKIKRKYETKVVACCT